MTRSRSLPWAGLLLWMAGAVVCPGQFLVDGDPGWTGVNDRLHPSQLPQSMAAGARNLRFDYGDARTRWAVNASVWGHASGMGGNPLAMIRWWEPETGTESLVVVTDGARTNGVGRVWRVRPGTMPVEIPLNGYDVWDTCRLVPARSGLVLLRQGDARWYVATNAVETASDWGLTFNVVPDVANGDRVLFGVTPGGELPTPLLPDTGYWVQFTANPTELQVFTDAATSTQVEFTTAGLGVFYMQKAAEQPGPNGNGAAPLILEPGWDSGAAITAWDQGWAGIPQSVSGIIESNATHWLAGNHRFAAGQQVEAVLTDAGFTNGTPYYVEPSDNHHFYLHLTSASALLGTSSNRVVSTDTSTNSFRANGYSLMPIVPMREGINFKNRLVGLAEANNVAVSDPGDFLHFTPYTGALTIAVGNGDPLTTLLPLGEDSLLLPSSSQILAITGLNSTDSSTWRLIEVTREYGCMAPLSAVQFGADAWMLSRSGVISVRQTDLGLQQGVAVPVSQSIQRKMAQIDWRNANRACAAWYGNKYLLAVPLKGQTGTPKNNLVLVYNAINANWDGWWDGAALEPVQFARVHVGLQERLAFLNSDGSVHWFSDGTEDLAYDGTNYSATAIPTELVTRAYLAGSPRVKQWNELELTSETLGATTTITSITEGVNQTNRYRTNITHSYTNWITYNQAPFYPQTQAERATLPYRKDYSLTVPATNELISAGTVYLAQEPGIHAYVPLVLQAGEVYLYTQGSAFAEEISYYNGSDWVTVTNATAAFVAPSGSVRLTAHYSAVASVVDAQVSLPGGLEVPDAGLLGGAHQTYVDRIAVREVNRSLQFKLNNSSGSVRWRSAYVSGKPDRADW